MIAYKYRFQFVCNHVLALLILLLPQQIIGIVPAIIDVRLCLWAVITKDFSALFNKSRHTLQVRAFVGLGLRAEAQPEGGICTLPG